MKKILTIFIVGLISLSTFANDVLVSTVSLVGQTTAGALNTHFTNVQFSINWKNSWYTNTNTRNDDGC